MRKPTYFAIFGYGLNALLWTIKAIADVMFQTYCNSVFGVVLSVLNAVLWNISFVVNLKRYRSNPEEQ